MHTGSNVSANTTGNTLHRSLAWRFFSGGRRSALVSMISSISLAGMVIAVALLVLVLSVMNGFEREFRERILGLVPHATLWLDRDSDLDALLSQLRSQQGVLHAVPFVEFRALAIRGTRAEPVLVQGSDYASFRERAEAFIDGGDTAGNNAGKRHPAPQQLLDKQVIAGAGLADKLGVSVGDQLRLMLVETDSAAAHSNLAARRTRVHPVALAATLRTGSELDQHVVVLPLHTAAAMAGKHAGFDGIQLQFEDVFSAPRRAAEIASRNAEVLRYADWTRSYGNLYTAIQLSRQIVVLLLASIVAIAAFNIFVTLGMVVRHKRPEIAILRSMGFAKREVVKVFVWQGICVSMIGASLGLLLGCALAWLAPPLVNSLQNLSGAGLLSTEIYPIDYLPSQIRLGDLLLIAAVALSMSFLATLIPAWQAARLQPASVLNGKGR